MDLVELVQIELPPEWGGPRTAQMVLTQTLRTGSGWSRPIRATDYAAAAIPQLVLPEAARIMRESLEKYGPTPAERCSSTYPTRGDTDHEEYLEVRAPASGEVCEMWPEGDIQIRHELLKPCHFRLVSADESLFERRRDRVVGFTGSPIDAP